MMGCGNTDTVEEIIEELKQAGFDELACDLAYKKRLIDDDYPDDLPISPESAREFADFITSTPLPGDPHVYVDPGGNVGLDWRIPDPARIKNSNQSAEHDVNDVFWGDGDGILAATFFPSGLVAYAGTSGPVRPGKERVRVSGKSPKAHLMAAMEPILCHIGD